MKRCNELSQELLSAYHEKTKGTRHPKIQCVCSPHGVGEGFELSYAGGTIRIKSQSPLAEVYALSLMNVVVPGGHWHEFLGLNCPRFPLRPLWLRTSPQNESDFHRICPRGGTWLQCRHLGGGR